MGAISKVRQAELVETEFGIARREGTIGAEPKALCHPLRVMFTDGLCESCSRVRERAMAPLDQTVGGSAEEAVVPSERESMLELYRTTEYLKGVAEVAKAILHHHLPRYAQLHLQAAEVAAKDGDAAPAQWALQNLKPTGAPVVDQPPKGLPGGREAGGAGGVQVLVGITLGQIPPGASTAQVVDVQATETEE